MNRFLVYAILLSVLFGCAHVLGFRDYTAILSGTAAFSPWHQYCGAVYLLLYVCFVGIVPILLIAGLVLFGLNKMSSQP